MPRRRIAFPIRLALAAALLLAARIAPAAVETRETVLPNGLKVLTREVHTAPVVSVQVWYKVGSRNERPGLTGLSHFLEHMLFKSSAAIKAGQVGEMVAAKGGWENAFTWLDYTGYVTTLPRAYLELPLKYEADRMIHASFKADEMEAERTVVLSEMEGDENTPYFQLSRAVRAAAFVAHPYHWMTVGWRPDVEAITRNQMIAYYHQFYGPRNATLVFVGDFNTDDVLARVDKYFGSIPAGPQAPPVVSVEPEQEGQRRVTVKRPGRTAYVEIAFHVPALAHPDHIPLDALTFFLGRGRGSRLYRALVDTRIATGVEAYHFDNADPSLLTIDATLAPGVSHERAEQAIMAELRRLADEPISDHELQRAINQARAAFIYGMESDSDQAFSLGLYETIGAWQYVKTYLDQVQKVTKADLIRACTTYLNEDNSTVGWLLPQGGVAPEGPMAPGPAGYRHRAQRRGAPATVAAAPAAEDQPAPKAPGVTRKVLGNGLVLIVQENHAIPVVSIYGMIKAGSMYDPRGRAGLANFVAGMLPEGTDKRSWSEMADELEFVAADLDISSGISACVIEGQSLSEHVEVPIEILADQLQRPSFPDAQVAKVRERIVNSISEELDDTDQAAERALYATIYPADHPMHHLPLGELDDVKAVTRDDLIAFHRRHYRPDMVILAVVGDITPDRAAALVEEHFGGWLALGPQPTYILPTLPQPGRAIRKAVYMPGRSQVDVAIGFPGVRRTDPAYHACLLLNKILGGGDTARLYRQIREKRGLAYEVYSQFRASHAAGPWVLRMGTNPKNADRAITVALDQLRLIRKEGPSKDEMQMWKSNMSGRVALDLETNAGIARNLVDAEFYDLGLDYSYRLPKIIAGLTTKQVLAAAKQYLQPDQAVVVTAGSLRGGGEFRPAK